MTTKQSILEVKIDPSGAKSGSAQATSAYREFLKTFDSGTKRINDSFQKFVVNAGKANSTLLSKMTSGWSSFTRFIGSATSKAFSGIGSALKTLYGGAAKLASILGPAGVVGAINEVIQAGLKIQKFGITFSVISGNIADGRKELQGLVNMTRALGSSFEASAAPAAKFFAAAKDSLLSSDIRDIFKAFSEVSVALQLNKQEVTGVFLALQQIASKGRVSMEELRLQLAERVPGAMHFAAQSMGMSMVEFEDAVRKGTINASEFLVKFGAVLHREFGPAAAIASKLGQSAINRFDTALTLFLNKISETGVLKGFQDFLDNIREKFLESSTVAEVLGTAIKRVIDRVNEFIKSIDDQSILDSVVFISNAFVTIYNTLLDIIPSLSTFTDLLKKGASFIGRVSEWFETPSAIEKQRKAIDKLKTHLNELQEVYMNNAKSAEELGSSGFMTWFEEDGRAMWKQMVEVENLIRDSEMALRAMESAANDTAKAIDKIQPKKMDLLSAKDFIGRTPSRGKPSVSPNRGELKVMQDEIDKKKKTIEGFIIDSNKLLEASTTMQVETVDKLADARKEMAEAQLEMIKLYDTAANVSGDVQLRDMLVASQKLVEQTKVFIEARTEFEDIFAAERDKENKRLTDVFNSEAEGMTQYLSFGRDLQKADLEMRQKDIQAAADQRLITQSQANELIETMELQHLAKMGDIRAQFALTTKEFDNQTSKQRVDSVLSDIVKTTSAVAGSNKKLFEINKKARIAQAVMELPAAVMTSFARGGGFPWGVIPAGITLASGLANIQQIRSSSFGGGGSGSASIPAGSSGSTPSISTPTPVQPASDAVFTQSINGDPRSVDSGGVTNINFRIEAMDGASVNRVLNSQKGNIISMVQSAYTERGNNGGPLK